jgi:signal transduction histidine kinase
MRWFRPGRFFIMDTWQASDVLDAAVQTLINERCRQAYLHDMRGGLQAISSSFELLARSAKLGAANAVLIENASSMAKRAMAHHEQALTEIVNQVTGPAEPPEITNLANLVQQAQHFLRNDALNKGVTLAMSGGEDALVFSSRNKLRSLILGLLALTIDGLPTGAELRAELSRVDSYVLLELRSALTYTAIREVQDLLCHEPVQFRPQELVLSFARHWIMANGGRVEIHSPAAAQSGLRIYYPLAAAQ